MPRITVPRDNPLARATAVTPPKPMASASAAATKRRVRSSKTRERTSNLYAKPPASGIAASIEHFRSKCSIYFVTAPKCPTKCFLRALGEMGTGNAYADWVRTQNASYRTEESQRLTQRATRDQCVIGPPAAANLKSAKWNLAIDLTVRTDHLQSTIHAVERVVSQERGKPTQLIPIRFIYADRLTREDRLLVAFDALVLSETLGREVGLGKIIHGDKSATLEVKTGALASEVRKRTEKISALLSSKSPPDLVLNRHCPECEFQTQCRQRAIEADDLSLLSGMTEKERASHRSKGIFTVMQLSYTFRPRKTPKRAKNPAKPRYMALQALAIRENTVYVHGHPELPDSRTQVYLDIEGLPESEFCYLIGALVVSGETEGLSQESLEVERRSDPFYATFSF